MLEKNKVYRARIQGYTSEGLGVARIDGQAVFVHQALRGEECDILILKVLKNAAFGKAVRVYEPSPHRVEPDCPYYGRCGGCDFRHMDRAEELDAKRQRVQDALHRIGGSAVTVEGIDGGEPLHYRNKSQYPVAADGSVGFYKARSHQVIPVERCRIQKPQADAAAQALRTYLRLYGVSCYDEKTRRGLVRYLYVRTNGAGQSLLCVLVNGKKLPHERELVDLLRQAVPETVGVVLGVNTRPTGAVLGQEYRTLWGANGLTDTLCGLTFRLSVPSFYQVNREQAERLYAKAIEYARLTGKETVLDLYCGAGTITLALAPHAKRVLGAEIVPEAIDDARENAARNGVENAEFFCGDASDVAKNLAQRESAARRHHASTRRARGWRRTWWKASRQMQPERVVYVSCDSATMARDVKRWPRRATGPCAPRGGHVPRDRQRRDGGLAGAGTDMLTAEPDGRRSRTQRSGIDTWRRPCSPSLTGGGAFLALRDASLTGICISGALRCDKQTGTLAGALLREALCDRER